FALREQVGFEGRTQLQLLCAGTTLQSDFSQHFERPHFGTGTTLAILLNFQQFANLLILLLGSSLFLGCFFAFRFCLALLLLIRLETFALAFQKWQSMSEMSQFGTRCMLHGCIFKADLDGFITITCRRFDLC